MTLNGRRDSKEPRRKEKETLQTRLAELLFQFWEEQKIRFIAHMTDDVGLPLKGGAGSGHFGHVGRPGQRGGSQPGSGLPMPGSIAPWPEEFQREDIDSFAAWSLIEDRVYAATPEELGLDHTHLHTRLEDRAFGTSTYPAIRPEARGVAGRVDNQPIVGIYSYVGTPSSAIAKFDKIADAVGFSEEAVGVYMSLNTTDFELYDEQWASRIKAFPLKGGPGSGHFGHAGRPGQRGGSQPGRGGFSKPGSGLSAEVYITAVQTKGKEALAEKYDEIFIAGGPSGYMAHAWLFEDGTLIGGDVTHRDSAMVALEAAGLDSSIVSGYGWGDYRAPIDTMIEHGVVRVQFNNNPKAKRHQLGVQVLDINQVTGAQRRMLHDLKRSIDSDKLPASGIAAESFMDRDLTALDERWLFGKALDLALKAFFNPLDMFWSAEHRLLVGILLPVLTRGAKGSVDEAADELQVYGSFGIDWLQPHEAALNWAIHRSDILARELNSTTSKALDRHLADFISTPGATVGALADSLFEVYGSEARALRAAITEITEVYAEGSLQAWGKMGPYLPGLEILKVWHTNEDDFVCPICGGVNGQERLLHEDFSNGLSRPPGHIGCRCWLGRVVRPIKAVKGGPGSGHFGHVGRPGRRGGSQPGRGGSGLPMPQASGLDSKGRRKARGVADDYKEGLISREEALAQMDALGADATYQEKLLGKEGWEAAEPKEPIVLGQPGKTKSKAAIENRRAKLASKFEASIAKRKEIKAEQKKTAEAIEDDEEREETPEFGVVI